MKETKEMIKLFYGMEIERLGAKEAFKKCLEEAKEMATSKEYNKLLKKEYKKNAELKKMLEFSDYKLGFISWTLMYKELSQVKESLPLLVNELRKIADDLEGFKDE